MTLHLLGKFLLLAAVILGDRFSAAAEKPNILLIMSDDMGFF